MKIFYDLNEWKTTRNSLSSALSLGFVPTMGNLHEGHLALVSASQQENDYTVVSLFVNYTQFNCMNDFNNYPRTLETDLAMLSAAGVDFCIVPTDTAMYPDEYNYRIEETQLSGIMEGGDRPGHYAGVLTVVMKLLNLTKPKNAYFGEKDYQQYLLIREMVASFFMDISIKACPTIRQQSGLANSSRNNRLNPMEYEQAERFAALFHQHKTCEAILEELQQEQFLVHYIEEHFGRRFAAITIGNIRLIDNYSI